MTPPTETIAGIFRQAQLATAIPYTHHFVGLLVEGIVFHGQLNIARASDLSGPYVVTIYILQTGGGSATGFQHRANTVVEALTEVEQLTLGWALPKEAHP